MKSPKSEERLSSAASEVTPAQEDVAASLVSYQGRSVVSRTIMRTEQKP
ncbi:MAG TPA: hypothetical protein VEB87_01995 [Nitrososphaerales archaeon]|nr:hypothetical protein [Nitrososphaerales archaeon]